MSAMVDGSFMSSPDAQLNSFLVGNENPLIKIPWKNMGN